MNLTFAHTASEHARRRSQQRGISSQVVDLVLEHYDIVLHAGDGCQTIRLSRSELAALGHSGIDRQLIDRAARVVVVMREDNGLVVTVLHDVGTDRRYRRQVETRKRSVQ